MFYYQEQNNQESKACLKNSFVNVIESLQDGMAMLVHFQNPKEKTPEQSYSYQKIFSEIVQEMKEYMEPGLDFMSPLNKDTYRSLHELTVRDFMSKQITCVIDSTPMRTAASMMENKRISCLPVVDYRTQNLLGVISLSDLVFHTYSSPAVSLFDSSGEIFEQKALQVIDQPVRNYMTTDVVTVSPDDPVLLACHKMLKNKVHRVIVTENQQVKGIFSRTDVLKITMQNLSKTRLKSHFQEQLNAFNEINIWTGNI